VAPTGRRTGKDLGANDTAERASQQPKDESEAQVVGDLRRAPTLIGVRSAEFTAQEFVDALWVRLPAGCLHRLADQSIERLFLAGTPFGHHG